MPPRIYRIDNLNHTATVITEAGERIEVAKGEHVDLNAAIAHEVSKVGAPVAALRPAYVTSVIIIGLLVSNIISLLHIWRVL